MAEKRAFEWDFAGSCAFGGAYGAHRTFSLGIFQWIPKSSGKGLKRGKVQKRIRGLVLCPAPTFAAARAECEKRNAKETRHA